MTQVTTTAQFRVEGGVIDAAPLFVELAFVTVVLSLHYVGGFPLTFVWGFSTNCLT